ncbi:MAG: hypothetical protein ACK4FV_05765 [Candidatus Nitrosocaldus sp.]
MIKLFLNKDFVLPMLGKDTFARLMRAGLEYDRASRRFRIKDGADLAHILAILREVVNEEISIELPCILCGNDAGCSECEFSSNCDRTSVSGECICKQCIMRGYTGYTEHISSLFYNIGSRKREGRDEKRKG